MPPFWHGLHQIAFGDLQPRLELTGVGEIVDVQIDRAGDRLHRCRGVVHVIPTFRIVQAANHVDAIGRDDEVAVVEVVLIGREHGDRAARLLSRIRRLLRRDHGADGDQGDD
jgi:hypothetical protein